MQTNLMNYIPARNLSAILTGKVAGMESVKRPITVHVKLAMKARIAQHVFHYLAAKMETVTMD